MSEVTIHSSNKLKRATSSLVFVIFAVSVMAYNNVDWLRGRTPWLLAVPALLFLIPLRQYVRTRFTRLRLEGGNIRYESGIVSRSIQVVRTPLIQNVRIEQSMLQRIFGVGDITIETTRGEGDLNIHNIDDPNRVAELILGSSIKPSDKRKK